MSRVSSVVEVNGNRYDASTGQLLGTVKKSAHQLRSTATGVMDGFIRQSSSAVSRKKTVKNRPVHGAKSVHRPAERSRTLMRSVVAKPLPKSKPAEDRALHSSTPENAGKHTPRAYSVKKHSKVNRFGHLPGPKPQENTVTTAKVGEVVRKPKHVPLASGAVPSSMTASATYSQVERLLDQALTSSRERASHRSRPARGIGRKVRHLPKWLSFSLLALALGLGGGVFAWQNIPQVAVKVAATRANISASVPAYTPEGFRFAAPVSYRSGEVVLSYQTTGGESYRITQRSSKLDSASLASNILLNETNVQTTQIKGNTIYIYGEKNDATWVNNGVLYTIKDGSGLDTDQILRIAGSL